MAAECPFFALMTSVRQAQARWNDGRVDRDPADHMRIAGSHIAIGRQQCRKWRVVCVVCREQQGAVRRQCHFIHSHGAAGADDLLGGGLGGGIQIDHMQRAVAVTGVEPPAMRRDAVGAGDIVVHAAGGVELDADETADGPLEGVALRVDDVDARIRAVAQVVLRAIRVDPADIERPERIARDLNRGKAPRFGRDRCPQAAARTCERDTGYRQRRGPDQRCEKRGHASATWRGYLLLPDGVLSKALASESPYGQLPTARPTHALQASPTSANTSSSVRPDDFRTWKL